MSYSPPLTELLTLGDCWNSKKFFDYAGMDINDSHTSELLAMVEDDELHESEDEAESWAPVHAWMALARMKKTEVVEPLLRLMEKFEDCDGTQEMAPKAFVILGPDVLPRLEKEILDNSSVEWVRLGCIETIGNIGVEYPEAKKRCISFLNAELANFSDHSDMVVTFLAAALAELGAVEAISNLRFAFMNDRIDPEMSGDYEEMLEIIMEKQPTANN